MEKVRVVVQAPDLLTQMGLAGALDVHGGVVVLPKEEREHAQVALVAVDRLRPDTISGLRQASAEFGTPVVLVIEELDDKELFTMVECKVVAVLPRARVTPSRLTHSVLTVAAGGALMPPTLLAELMTLVQRLQREFVAHSGTNHFGLAPREIDVLRLVSEGNDTAEVAAALGYSERTIKGVISTLIGRLNLRNRSHAVAYALRAGLI